MSSGVVKGFDEVLGVSFSVSTGKETSVTEAGRNSSSENTSGVKGQIPVALNPLVMLGILKARA